MPALLSILLAALLISGCTHSAASKQSEAMVRQQVIQVREFETTDTAVSGLEHPADIYGRKVAEMIAQTLTDEGMKASLIGGDTPPTGTLVVEGRVLAIEGGNRALRWVSGGFGAGAVEVSVEGRAVDANGKTIGEFHAEDSGKGGFYGGNGDSILDECLETVASDSAMRIINGDYNGRASGNSAAQPVARSFNSAAASAMNKIVVTPGDIAGGRYDILGQVEWPPKGQEPHEGAPCDPSRIRMAAFDQFGESVSAVIGFHTWDVNGLTRCGGAAVHFTQTPDKPAATH